MNLKIAFDMDGVLINLMPVIQKHLFIMYQDAGTIIENGTHKIKTSGNLSSNKVWKAIDRAYMDIDEIQPIHGASTLVAALHCFSESPVRVVTARPERSRLITESTLINKFPGVPFDLRMNQNKLLELDDIGYFVEDRRKTAIDLAVAGKIVFLLDKPYNQVPGKEHENIIRLYDLLHLSPHVTSFINRGIA